MKKRDLEKALHHYTLCYTYGEADKKDYAIAALGYFYAGWLSAILNNDLENAINLTRHSLKFDPKLCESHYHLAKFYAILEDYESAIAHIKKLIVVFDRNYCIKIAADHDFNRMMEKIDDLIKDLIEENLRKTRKVISENDREFINTLTDSISRFEKTKEKLSFLDRNLKKQALSYPESLNLYLDTVKLKNTIPEIKKLNNDLNNLKNRIASLGKEFNEHIKRESNRFSSDLKTEYRIKIDNFKKIIGLPPFTMSTSDRLNKDFETLRNIFESIKNLDNISTNRETEETKLNEIRLKCQKYEGKNVSQYSSIANFLDFAIYLTPAIFVTIAYGNHGEIGWGIFLGVIWPLTAFFQFFYGLFSDQWNIFAVIIFGVIIGTGLFLIGKSIAENQDRAYKMHRDTLDSINKQVRNTESEIRKMDSKSTHIRKEISQKLNNMSF